MQHHLTFDEETKRFWLARNFDQPSLPYRLHSEHGTVPVALIENPDGTALLRVGARDIPVVIALHGNVVHIHMNGQAFSLAYTDAPSFHGSEAMGSAADIIAAPMPGSVVAVNVAAGDTVSEGQTLVVIESMKLEASLKAPRDGVVESVLIEIGQTFDRDAVLIQLVSEET